MFHYAQLFSYEGIHTHENALFHRTILVEKIHAEVEEKTLYFVILFYTILEFLVEDILEDL